MTEPITPGRVPAGATSEGDAVLIGDGREAGLDGAAFAACLSDAPYRDWPPYVTACAVKAGVSGTPTVLVAGAAVRPDPRAITAAVARANGGR